MITKKTMKIMTVTMTILTVLMVVFSFTQIAFASVTPPTGVQSQPPEDQEGILNIAGQILGFLQVLAVALLVIMVAVLGIKYMAGSAEEKAEYKKSFVPLIVGAILVFAAVTIANFIFNIVQGS